MDIRNKTAVVVGGASGLGEATCRALVAAGAQLVVFDQDKAKADSLAKELSGQAFQVDVSDAASLEQAFASCGEVHAVVNTAGICPAERVLGKEGIASLQHFEETVAVNLTGSFNVIRLAAQLLSVQSPVTNDGERGVIINTASIAAYEGQVGQAAYSASKAGVVGMTLPVARELKQFGIRVMTIAPGVFQTPMVAGLSEKVSVALSESVPFPSRLGLPQEYAALVLHILENSYLNGETIRLDAALRMS
jgi:NAD(P)-dependent dehydrogenase (short-subunit alcohol dehydrogenase family)